MYFVVGYELGSLEPLTEPEKHAHNIFYEPTPWPKTDDADQLLAFKVRKGVWIILECVVIE